MTWSISNIDNHLSRETWESFIDHSVAAGIMIGCLVLCLSYPAAHSFLSSVSKEYRKLDKDKQVVVVHHTIEAGILGILFIPLTYLVSSVYFEDNTLEQMHQKVSTLGTLMFVIIIMYLYEIASRYQNIRPLVLVHHLCAYADSLFPALCLTTANLKAASLLVYFITYEFLIFVGLVMYRLNPSHKLTRPIIMTGMIVFGLSRPLQLVWIIGGLATTWENLVVWQAIVQIFLTVLFSTLQLYSLTIHFSLWKKCGRHCQQKKENPTKEVDQKAKNDTTATELPRLTRGTTTDTFHVSCSELLVKEGTDDFQVGITSSSRRTYVTDMEITEEESDGALEDSSSSSIEEGTFSC